MIYNFIYIMICVNVILVIALYLIGKVCLIIQLILTLLVFLKKDWTFFGKVKIIIVITNPT